jgi:hypothetical protein
MPVIIAAEDYDRWLASGFHDAQQLQCMQPFPPGEMILPPEENRARSGQRPESQQPQGRPSATAGRATVSIAEAAERMHPKAKMGKIAVVLGGIGGICRFSGCGKPI